MTDLNPNRTQPDYKDTTIATISLVDASHEMVTAVADLLAAAQRHNPSADIIGSTNYSGFVIWERKSQEDIDRELAESEERSAKWDQQDKERKAVQLGKDERNAEALGVSLEAYLEAKNS